MRRAAAAVFLATLVPVAALTHDAVFAGGNDASRFAQIESLVDRGERYIDASRYRWTVDKVRLDGHSYSNKPPLLSLAGAAVYRVLKGVTGWSFATHEGRVVKVVTVALVGLPFALLVAGFFLALAPQPPRTRWLLTVALAAGTLLTSFAGTLNNHVPAAALLLAGVLAAQRGAGAWAGLATGLAVCVDVLPGAGFAPVVLLLAQRAGGRQALARCVAGLAAMAVVFGAADYAILGSPLPPKLVPGAVDESSAFGAAAGGVLLPERWSYPLECLFGWHGLFTVSPVLLFGAAGLAIACRRPPEGVPLLAARAVAAGVVLQVVGHLLLAGSYGGWSYGFRYLIPVMPLLLLFAPQALTPRVVPLFLAALAVSVLFALLGAYHPWPPAYEQEARKDPVASLVRNPIGGNAACWLVEHAPRSALRRSLESAFVSPDPGLAARYQRLFFASKRVGAR